MPRRIRGGYKRQRIFKPPKKTFFMLFPPPPPGIWSLGPLVYFFSQRAPRETLFKKAVLAVVVFFPPFFVNCLYLWNNRASGQPSDRPERPTAGRRREEHKKVFLGGLQMRCLLYPHFHHSSYPFYRLIFLSFFGDVYSLKSQKSKKSLYPTVFFHLKQYKTIRKFSCSCFFFGSRCHYYVPAPHWSWTTTSASYSMAYVLHLPLS